MSRYKHTPQYPNKLQRAISGQDIGKITAKLGEIIQTINIAILLLAVLALITQCQPINHDFMQQEGQFWEIIRTHLSLASQGTERATHINSCNRICAKCTKNILGSNRQNWKQK